MLWYVSLWLLIRYSDMPWSWKTIGLPHIIILEWKLWKNLNA